VQKDFAQLKNEKSCYLLSFRRLESSHKRATENIAKDVEDIRAEIEQINNLKNNELL